MCRGLYGTHRRAKEAMRNDVRDLLLNARRELDRLEFLYEDILWYNHEARWSQSPSPWRGPAILLHLCGYRILEITRNGKQYEIGEFPTWFHGSSTDAPILPIDIIANEVADAYQRWRNLNEALQDIDDWAPGGVRYKALVESEPLRTCKSSN